MSRICLFLLSLCLSACYLAHYPVTPPVAKSATYIVLTGNSLGTAWAVDKWHLVTAGHVCETMASDFVIMNDYRRMRAFPVRWDYAEDGSTDVCVLETSAALDSWLVIAEEMPKVGDTVRYVGYPRGEYYEGTGTFLGDLDGPAHNNDAAFNASCDHGASGSAVYTRNGVWGVLVRLRTDGGYIHPVADGCVAITLDKLRKILDDVGVKYDVTPGDPSALP